MGAEGSDFDIGFSVDIKLVIIVGGDADFDPFLLGKAEFGPHQEMAVLQFVGKLLFPLVQLLMKKIYGLKGGKLLRADPFCPGKYGYLRLLLHRAEHKAGGKDHHDSDDGGSA